MVPPRVVAEFGSMASVSVGCGGAGVAGLCCFLACPPVRLRLLRAACRLCSRGPARRALVVVEAAPDGGDTAGAPGHIGCRSTDIAALLGATRSLQTPFPRRGQWAYPLADVSF